MRAIDFETEVQQGLPCADKRICHAIKCLDYFEGHFEKYHSELNVSRRGDEVLTYRYSWIMNFIVRKLTEILYKTNPVREIKKYSKVNAWLQKVYKDCSIHGKWHAADQLSMVTDLAAFQVVPTGLETDPIKIHLWHGGQIHVWTDPDDSTCPVAVCTIDDCKGQRRYTLWTDEEIAVYLGGKSSNPLGEAILQSKEANPYKTLPFSFVHYTYPTLDFWGFCPGKLLQSLNENFNRRLTEIDRAQRVYLKPPLFATNVSTDFAAKSPYMAGDIISLSAADKTAYEGSGVKPEVNLLKFDQTAVPTAWEDLLNYGNHTLETMGVPESAIQMVQSVARSGESIKAEQIPLLLYAKSRQPIFELYECQLAKKILEVASAYACPGAPLDQIKQALQDFRFSLRWGEPNSELPGPERDREDIFNLELGITDEIEILMRRNGFTEDEAISHLKQIAKRKQLIKDLIGSVVLPKDPVGDDGQSGEQTVAPEESQDEEGETTE